MAEHIGIRVTEQSNGMGDVDAAASPILNDIGENWSRAEIPYGDGDRGTPRQGLEEFDPAIEFVPRDSIDFGRTNLANLPLPIQKDIDLSSRDGA